MGVFSRRRLLAGTGGAAAAVALSGAAAAGQQRDLGWVGTWAAAAGAGVTDNGYPNYSIRSALHASIGGHAVRVRLSNAFGAAPVDMGHVTVALAAKPGVADAVPGTLRELTFSGQRSMTIPTGADVFSDPVALTVPTGADLLVTTFVPTPSGPVTYHPYAGQTSFFTTDGDHASDVSGAAFDQTTQVWHYVDGVDVLAESRGAIVTLGDSITDGVGSTWDANRRWPDQLAARIARLPAHQQFGVVNAGISGNRLLLDGGGFGINALARFDRDVLAKTAARTMIVLLGINDIQQDPHQTDPARITAAHRQLISQGRARGLRVIGATLTPFKGWTDYSPTLEATRSAVNDWIRHGGAYDAVFDFDAAVRNPADPLAMLPAYDSGDHLHPGDAGYQAIANSIPLHQL
ncbi:MAG TPA: SGNH/GDSL hydrolase family protein [Pseudonocardiaceae bacterium]|jgi:lysophospholipase L1-like esterase|nr:SGNH/GDSL hydrolase family protein [Pseudonocardiaceae bacterium]